MTVRTTLRYSGKAKHVFETDTPGVCLIEFTDAATAFNGAKRGSIDDKGQINAATTELLCTVLERAGIETHLIRRSGPCEIEAHSVEIVPLEVVVRNIAAGSFSKRLGVEEGTALAHPIVEFCWKRDDLDDPLLTRAHIDVLGIASADVVNELERQALLINDVLRAHLAERDVVLVDFKLEFGHTRDGRLILADEISPDTCRFWDRETGEKLDKDRFRRDLGGTEQAYRALLERLGGSAATLEVAR